MRSFGRFAAGAVLGVALIAAPATASAAPMSVSHEQVVAQASGTGKPNPDVYPYRYGVYYGAYSLEECVGRGVAGLGSNQWEVFYCWETSSTSTELWFGYGG
jgi:hypothetical protein